MCNLALKNFEPRSVVILQDLGSGSYGYVKLLRDKSDNQLLVGKYFLAGGDQKTIKRELANAEREAQILACINHENVVRFVGTTTSKNSLLE